MFPGRRDEGSSIKAKARLLVMKNQSRKINSLARYKIIALVFVITLNFSCFGGRFSISEPNTTRFRQIVKSQELRQNFEDGKLVVGMPYYVVGELFAEWGEPKPVAVASVGSKQPLRDVEGWSRVSHDPSIKVYLVEYKTKKGRVSIWYRYPDFYRLGLLVGDTLLVYARDTVLRSTIDCILGPNGIVVGDSLIGLDSNTVYFCEVRHVDHAEGKKASFWYTLMVDDPITFYLEAPDYRQFPIEKIEKDGEPADTFQWRN